MKATITEAKDGSITVSINGQVFPAKYVNHTSGPAMMVATPDRTVFGIYEYEKNPSIEAMRGRRVEVLSAALARAGFDVEVQGS